MYKSPNTFKVEDGEEIDLDEDSHETLAKDSKGAAKLASKVLDETDSKSSAIEVPLSSATNLEKLSEMSKQAEKTASAMVMAAGSLMDMIEFTKALTQHESEPEAASTDSPDEAICVRPDRSTESCSCACHPAEIDSGDTDSLDGLCKCKASSRANLKTSRKTQTTPETERETSIIIQTGSNTGDEPIIVVAHPPEPHKGPIALYPDHQCSAQCHCYLRHIPQGPPLDSYLTANKEGHDSKPKKCGDQCHCSCHKEVEKTPECAHTCLLHCGGKHEPEQEQEKAVDSAEPDAADTEEEARVSAVNVEDKPRASFSESIAKLGSKFKPASMAKASTIGRVSDEGEKSTKMSEMKAGSKLQQPSTSAGEEAPEGGKRNSSRSSGKGSIFSRLSNGFRRSK